jgi:MFS family permease
VHGASALLVVPQFAVAGFGAEFLVRSRDWDAAAAGRVLAVVSLAGALGRLAAGRWSDVVGSRLEPMRQIAVVCAALMAALGLGAATGSALVVVPLALAAVVSVTDNGLGYTATAELAGRAWSGRALGMQNTAQNLVAFATPPAFAAVVGLGGYPWAFGVCALAPALAAAAIPVRAAAALAARAELPEPRTTHLRA